jgi:hypothetical protein
MIPHLSPYVCYWPLFEHQQNRIPAHSEAWKRDNTNDSVKYQNGDLK